MTNLAISREKKEELLKGYLQELNLSEAVIITGYRGLKVSQVEQLRKKVREAEGSFAIVKNTLAERALKEAGIAFDADMLTGPIGIGFCHSNVGGVAKAITDFAKQNELLTIRGGMLGNRVIDEAGVKNLATLPSLDVLRAQLLGLINAPASQLAGVVAGGVRQLVNVFNAYAEKEAEA
ncbi:MAG: 50S ribosomal protein L10 [Anaerolineae bacterium]|nr:50S ribosomal protein L10 [Anaerolineae bacterium]